MTAVPERLVVLLADDDPNDIALIRRAFQRLSSVGRLVEVEDGDTAIHYLRGHGDYADRTAWPLPRMLVLDQWMPRLSGMDVLRWVRTDPRFVSLPAILLSDHLPPSQTELAGRLRAASCLKALTTQGMKQALERAMCSAVTLAWQTASPPEMAWHSGHAAPTLALRSRPERA